MNKEILDFLQSFFIKSFIVSFIIFILACIACIFAHDIQVAVVEKFFHANAATVNLIILLILGIWKIFIIQFTLIPAIVIWYIQKSNKCKSIKVKI